MQRFQGRVVQHRVDVLERFAHGEERLVRLGHEGVHLVGSHEAGHIHRDFLVLGYLLARRQLGFALSLGSGFRLGHMLLDIGLLRRVRSAVIGAQRGGVGFQRGHQRVGIDRIVVHRGAGVLRAGLFLRLGDRLTKGRHAQPFLAGLVGSFLLGNGYVAFHHALAGGVEQGADAEGIENIPSALRFALRHMDDAQHNQRDRRNGQQDGDDALCLALCHCAPSPFSSWSSGLMPDMARPKSASLASGERISTSLPSLMMAMRSEMLLSS